MTEIFKYFKYVYDSRIHLLEMLEDRGYDVSHLMNYTHDEIKVMLNEQKTGKFVSLPDIGPLDILLEKNTGTPLAEKIYVKYRLESKFKGTTNLNAQITEIFEKYLTNKDTLIILNICRVLIKPGVKEKTDEEFGNNLLITKNYFVQLFGLENFLFNVSRHQFVPKHRILSKQESLDLITKFNCNVKNIPTIKRDDAQAKYIGLRPRQICEIKVENVSSGYTTKYRLCVTN
jgi:DNA-directed RNA polymerase subunit H (RpoH/RPB5)